MKSKILKQNNILLFVLSLLLCLSFSTKSFAFFGYLERKIESAENLTIKGKFDKAEKIYLNLLVEYADDQDISQTLIAKIYSNLGDVKIGQGIAGYSDAKEYLKRAIDLIEKKYPNEASLDKESKIVLAYTYERLGYVYYHSNPEISEKYYQKSLKYSLQQNLLELLLANYYNLDIVYQYIDNQTESAKFKDKFAKLLKTKFAGKEPEFRKVEYIISDPKWKIDVKNDNPNFVDASQITLSIINKVTAKNMNFTIPIASQIRVGDILITTKACLKSIDSADYPENKALIQVDRINNKEESKIKKISIFSSNKEKYLTIFYGWLFSSSIGISSVEDPVYDVLVKNCK